MRCSFYPRHALTFTLISKKQLSHLHNICKGEDNIQECVASNHINACQYVVLH